MEFKKCVRCGCFFISNNDVCCNCEAKDKLDIARLNTFIEEEETVDSIETLSTSTGISVNNLNRFIKNKGNNGLNINL
jgi:hypothetical protein